MPVPLKSLLLFSTVTTDQWLLFNLQQLKTDQGIIVTGAHVQPTRDALENVHQFMFADKEAVHNRQVMASQEQTMGQSIQRETFMLEKISRELMPG